VRLVGFHHAGGSAAVYYPLVNGLPPDWDLLLLDLPGRGRRAGRVPMEEMSAVTATVLAEVLPWTGGGVPVALFGHSMGAIVALETARGLEELGRPPVWTGVSGRVAPHHPGPSAPLHTLADEELLEVMLGLGGMPDRVTESPRFLSRFLHTVRADLSAVHSYRPEPGRRPLATPLAVFGGTQDVWAPPSAMHLWRAETAGTFTQRFFPGGHFYFLDHGFATLARHVVRLVGDSRHEDAPQPA
jgi:surfactin synthase thioesterase subunit